MLGLVTLEASMGAKSEVVCTSASSGAGPTGRADLLLRQQVRLPTLRQAVPVPDDGWVSADLLDPRPARRGAVGQGPSGGPESPSQVRSACSRSSHWCRMGATDATHGLRGIWPPTRIPRSSSGGAPNLPAEGADRPRACVRIAVPRSLRLGAGSSGRGATRRPGGGYAHRREAAAGSGPPEHLGVPVVQLVAEADRDPGHLEVVEEHRAGDRQRRSRFARFRPTPTKTHRWGSASGSS